MYDWAVKNNMLSEKKWDEYDWGEVILTLPTVTPEKVKYYYKLAYRKFYLRPRFIMRTIAKIRSLNDFTNLIYGFKGVVNVLKLNN